MKYIVIVPDGMADEPLEELGQRTPLAVAHTANMDFLAKNGTSGLVKTIPDRQHPGSEIGNLALLGYNPDRVFSGRAPLEAANLGITLAEDEVAFRCNLVTVRDNRMVDYSAGHITTPEAAILIQSLNEGIAEDGIRFVCGKSYRHLLILRVRDPQALVRLRCTPPHDILGKDITRYLPQGTQAPVLLKFMERAQQILDNHPVNNVRIDLGENPANTIWLWGQGTRPQLPLFKQKYGVSGAMISAVDLVNGIGRLAGLQVVDVPGITGYYDTNYLGKGQYALDALRDHDFVFVHIEAPDEAGHNGDAKAKIQAIERIDREIVGPVLNHFGRHDDVRIMVLPDHPTPVARRTHTRDAVCYVMYGKGIAVSGAAAYTEALAREGRRFTSGEALMGFFMNQHSA